GPGLASAVSQEGAEHQTRLISDEALAMLGLGVADTAELQLVIDPRRIGERRRRLQRIEAEIIFRVVGLDLDQVAGGQLCAGAGLPQIALAGSVGQDPAGEKGGGEKRTPKGVG